MPRLEGGKRSPRQQNSGTGETPFVEVTKYRHFESKYHRERAYEAAARLTEYLREHQIANVMFVDRAARAAWVGVHEYWKTHFPEEKRPGFYFINPDVFNGSVKKFFHTRDPKQAPHDPALTEGIQSIIEQVDEEFTNTYTELSTQKDLPLMIYDTCLHTGRTIYPLTKLLEAQGFTKVEVATASAAKDGALLQSNNEVVMDGVGMCDPFGYGDFQGVAMTEGSLLSRPDAISQRRGAAALRKEIRQIIRDQGKK